MDWETVFKRPYLHKDEIHLWKLQISKFKPYYEDFWNTLSESEKEKANKFRFNKDKICNVLARGVLKKLLYSYCNTNSLFIQYTKYNKPYINDLNNVRFNISHSKNYIIIAIAKNIDLGVDVEFINKNAVHEDVSKSFFSTEEQYELSMLKDSEKTEGFYRCWTRKEAFIKALGTGLSFPLDKFVVSLHPYKAELLKTKWDENEKKQWLLKSFTPNPDYVGAIATKAKKVKIRLLKYQLEVHQSLFP